MAKDLFLKSTSVDDKRPTPSQLEIGEISLGYNEAGAFLCCKDTAGNIQQVGGVKIDESRPDAPVKQTLWFKPSTLTLFVFDGDKWLPVAAGGGGGGGGGGINQIIGNDGIDADTFAGIVTLEIELAGGDDGLEFTSSKLSATLASATDLGSVKVGENINVTAGEISVPEADTSVFGVVKIGDGLHIEGDGTLSVDDFSNSPSYANPVNADLLPIYDVANSTSKKITIEELIAKRARDSRRIYLSKDTKANDSNNGTSPEEPLLTFAAAIAAAEPGDVIEVSPGTYTEASLPLRVPRDVGIFAKSLRQVKIQPAAGQEMNGFFKVDSGFWVWGLEFAGHQADLANNQQSWAISFDEQADNTAAPLNASGLGAFILKSPYVQNCSSVTAEDDAGTAGSVSVGDTGGGIEVDGDKCAANSPIRSMVVDSFTQVNLGGPGCLVRSDGYAQLVSFFGTFCTFHVKTESGGQANLSGGGTTDFGDQGLVADGYSRLPNFTGAARIASYGADRAEAAVTIDVNTDTFTTVSAHPLVVNDQLTFNATDGTLPTGLAEATTYFVISSGLTSNNFKVSLTQGGASVDITGSASGTYQFTRQGELTAEVISLTSNRIGTLSRPNPGQLMFPRQTFPSAGQPGSAGNAVGVTAGVGSNFMVILNSFSYAHEYVSGGTVTIGGTTYTISSASYSHATGVTTLSATGYTPSTGDSAVLSGLDFICPIQGAYIITGSVPIDASGNVVAADSASLAGYRINFFNTVNGGLRSPIAASQVIDFRLRSQISCALHTMEYVGSGTNYNALPWNGGVPIAANQRVELNNGRVFGATINEKGDFEIGDGTFSIDGTTGSATINTSEFNISGLNFVGPFSRNGGFSTVGVQLREVSDNTSLIASTGASDGNTVPTQNAVKDYVDSTTVQSVDLSSPTGFTSTGGPITGSGTLALGYDTGYQGYLTAESTKLSGIEAGATADQTDAEIKVAYENNADTNAFTDAEQTKLSGIESGATADQTAAEIKTAYESNSDTNAFTDAEQTKLSGIEAGAQVNVATNLSYANNTRVISSSTGTDATIPLAVAAGDAGLLTGADKTQLDNLSTNLAGKANLSGGKLAISELPDLAITEFKGVVADQTAMLAVTGEKGDWVTRSDDGKVYLITGNDPTQVGSWTALSYPASPVLSVNTQTGAVVLDADDISDSTTTNKYTTAAEISKLSGIESGAEVNVQADFNETDASSDSFIQNKPTIPSGNLVDDTAPQLGGNLDLNGKDIITTSNGDIDLDPNGSGVVIAKGNATRGSGQIKLNCENNSHGITLKGPPHSAGAGYTLTLPNDDGSASDFLQTDGSGNLTWAAGGGGGGGLTNFTESQSTYGSSGSGYASVSSIFDAIGTDTNINAVLSPKGYGAIIGQEPDGTTAGGNARGANSVDLQFLRGDVAQVASGLGSVLIGGTSNKATSNFSAVLGGTANTITSVSSAILGGGYNTISGNMSISNGYQNTLSGYSNFAFGYQNTTSGSYSIALGRESTADADYSMALGVKANTHGIKGLHAIAPFGTNSSTYKNPQFYKVILTAVTPDTSADSGNRFMTTDGGSVISGSTTDTRYNSIYIGRTDGTNARQIYIEGIIKASKVGGGLNHGNHGIWEVSGFLRGPGPNGDSMSNISVTKKRGYYNDPILDDDYGSSGSGNSEEWWWRLKVRGSGLHSLLWTAYLTCYVTDET